METPNKLRNGIAVGGVLIATALVGRLLGQPGLLMMGMMLVFGLFAFWIDRYVLVRVPETKVYVIFNRETRAFVRFIGHGRHLLFFPLEYVAGELSTMPASAQGKCLQAQTNGGIAVDAGWSVTYQLQPETAVAPLQPIIARLMQGRMHTFFHKHSVNCLQAIVSQYTVSGLSGPGVLPMLETRLHQALAERLKPFGIKVLRVMVTSLTFPPHVTKALEAARERELYGESQARMLERLQKALSQFTDAEMERLLRLQQLREMGQNGVTLHVPWMPMPNTILPQEHEARGQGKQPGNGRSVSDSKFPPPTDGDNPNRGDWPPSV